MRAVVLRVVMWLGILMSCHGFALKHNHPSWSDERLAEELWQLQEPSDDTDFLIASWIAIGIVGMILYAYRGTRSHPGIDRNTNIRRGDF